MGRILWAAQFHVGCTFTALPVVLRLRDRGHEVIVLTVPSAETTFRDFGFGFLANRGFPVYDFARPDDAPDGRGEENYQRWWRKLARLQMADTLEVLGEQRYDLVFGGSCMQLCGHGLAAERAGIPWVSYIDFLVDETERREQDFPDQWDRWRATLGLPPERRPCEESLWFPFSPHLTLYLVHPGLAFGPAPAYVHRVGASVWESPHAVEEPEWLAELGMRRPAVLVSTSTLWQDDSPLVSGVAAALAGEDVDVVATVPNGQEFPALPGNVIVTGQFPHALILPRVRCVVCSAGLGTVTRALCAGIPVVAVPRSGDGFNVARSVAQHGAGVAIHPDHLRPALLRDAVHRCLTDRSLQLATARFSGPLVTPEALDTAVGAVEALLP